MSTKTEAEEYEDINIKDNNIENNLNIDKRESEMNDLQIIAKQLTIDYSNYFDIKSDLEKKETDDSIEDLLTHLEEFCGLLEIIRTDNNICLEQVLKKVHEKSLIMDQIYHKIDKLQEFVQIVKKSVDDMEEEVTKAEQLFGNNNKVKKFLSSFISSSSSKPSTSQRKAKYEPKDIFITSDYIKSCDSETDQNLSQLTNNQ